MSDSVGCGAAGGDSWPGSSRSTPITPRNSSSAWRAVERSSSAVSRTFRRQVGLDLQRARVQRHQRDPVGEHVVHLARDPGALGHPDPVGVQTLLGLGAQGTLAQREEELTSGPDEHAPGGGRERERGDHQDHRQRVGRGAVDGEDQQADGIHSAATSSAGRSAAVHGEGGQREEPGGGGGDRERPQHEHRPAQRRAASAAATTAQRQASAPQPTSTTTAGSTTVRRCRCSVGLRKSAPSAAARRHPAASSALSRPVRGPAACPAGPDRPVPAATAVPAARPGTSRGPGHDPSVEAGARAGHRRKSVPTATKGGAGRAVRSVFPPSGPGPPADVRNRPRGQA